jgi:hypothetical protein
LDVLLWYRISRKIHVRCIQTRRCDYSKANPLPTRIINAQLTWNNVTYPPRLTVLAPLVDDDEAEGWIVLDGAVDVLAVADDNFWDRDDLTEDNAERADDTDDKDEEDAEDPEEEAELDTEDAEELADEDPDDPDDPDDDDDDDPLTLLADQRVYLAAGGLTVTVT